MLDELLEVLGNSHFEAYVAGPLLGVAFGAIFSALIKPPRSHHPGASPQEKKREVEEYRRLSRERKEIHHHHHHYNTRSMSNDDGGTMFFAAGFAMLVALFLFAAFLPEIAGTLYFFNTAIAMCCIVAALLACLTGRFNTSEWWFHAVFSAIASVACLWLTVTARKAISPDVVAYAQSLIVERPLSVGLVLNAAFKFFTSLRNEYVQWIAFDMLAFICGIVCTIGVFLRFTYYVSLSNVRDDGGRGWVWVALRTKKFGGAGNAVFMIILFVVGALLARGDVYQWLHPR